jgi:hypothetical protein
MRGTVKPSPASRTASLRAPQSGRWRRNWTIRCSMGGAVRLRLDCGRRLPSCSPANPIGAIPLQPQIAGGARNAVAGTQLRHAARVQTGLHHRPNPMLINFHRSPSRPRLQSAEADISSTSALARKSARAKSVKDVMRLNNYGYALKRTTSDH